MPKLSEKLLVYRVMLGRTDEHRNVQRKLGLSDDELKRALMEKVRKGQVVFPGDIDCEMVLKIFTSFASIMDKFFLQLPGHPFSKRAFVYCCIEHYYIQVYFRKKLSLKVLRTVPGALQKVVDEFTNQLISI